MSCDCSTYQPLELDRPSINKRIKASKAIMKRLEPLATNADLRVTLFSCPTCRLFWQSGHEWNFADKEYLFQVPLIEISEWLREPYAQPAAMLIYSALMRDFFERNSFEPTDSTCREPGCSKHAIRFTVHCRDHHIEALRRIGSLPKKPVGRLFPPYYVESAKVA